MPSNLYTAFPVKEKKLVATIVEKSSRHIYDDLIELVSEARRGLSTEIFYSFSQDFEIPEKELAGFINVNARTISNYRAQDKTLEPYSGEHLLKIVALFTKGRNMFGNTNEFKQWLNNPFWRSDETPYNFLNTSGGVDIISSELDKLAEGYPL